MGQTRSDGRRTRERVLAVAIPLFAKHGFAGTSIRMVSTAAEVNVATLAYHFQDKEGLYTTVVTRLHEDLQASFPNEMLVGSSPDVILHQVVAGIWAFCKEHREHNRLLMRHVLDSGALPSVVTERWTDSLMTKGVGFLRIFRPDWSETDARLLINAVQHLLVRWALEDPKDLALILGAPDDVDAAIVRFVEDLIRVRLGLPPSVAGAAHPG